MQYLWGLFVHYHFLRIFAFGLVPLLVDYFAELQDDHSRFTIRANKANRASVVGGQEMPLL